MDETTFIETPEVTVTSARLVVRGETFAMTALQSFRTNASLPFWRINIPIFMMLGGAGGVLMALVRLVTGGSLVVITDEVGQLLLCGLAVLLGYFYRERRPYKPKYRVLMFLGAARFRTVDYDNEGETKALQAALASAVAMRL